MFFYMFSVFFVSPSLTMHVLDAGRPCYHVQEIMFESGDFYSEIEYFA